jgi:hypothetical protein
MSRKSRLAPLSLHDRRRLLGQRFEPALEILPCETFRREPVEIVGEAVAESKG